MRRALLTAALLLSLGARAAAAQDGRLGARLDQATAAQVTAIADSARAERLPTEPLVQKALEGQAKGAEPARIVAAVRLLRGQLRDARAGLGERASEMELVAGAAALRAGIPRAALAELRSLRRDEALTVPLGVLADMVAHGMAADAAWRSIRDLARSGSDDRGYLALRDRLDGVAPARTLPPPDATSPRQGRPDAAGRP